MDTKHIHCMLEKISEYGKCMIEAGVGGGNVNLDDAGKIVDMVKDLACAEKDALIAKEMRKAHEDDEAEEKYIRKMLKEENKDEFKHYMEEYGDDGERRFYDDWRYASGRFAPKGRGSYEPRRSGRRRGYVEPLYYHVMPEDYDEAERYRDMDRMDGKMYYTPMAGNAGNMGNSANSGRENMSGNNIRGYEDGYRDGKRDGKGEGSRYDKAKRGYEETKEMHKGNTPEDKQVTMREAEKLVNVFMDGLEEALEDSPIEVKNMVKTKATSRLQKMS